MTRWLARALWVLVSLFVFQFGWAATSSKFETDLTYNARDQLTDLHTFVRNTGPTRVRYENIRYNGVGYPISAAITQPSWGQAPNLSGSVTWSYDDRNNMTQEVRRRGGSLILYDTGSSAFDGADNAVVAFGRSLPVNANSDVALGSFATDAQGNSTLFDGLALNWNAADDYIGNERYVLVPFSDGPTAKKTVIASGRETYFMYDLSGNVVTEIAGANASVPSGSQTLSFPMFPPKPTQNRGKRHDPATLRGLSSPKGALLESVVEVRDRTRTEWIVHPDLCPAEPPKVNRLRRAARATRMHQV
jgi:hypothetical protein